MSELLVSKNSAIVTSETSEDQFAALIDVITGSLAQTSRRVYAHTYR